MLAATLGAALALVIIGLVHRALRRDFNREWRESLRVKASGPLLVLLLLSMSSGCVSSDYKSRDWSACVGPGAEWFLQEEVVFPHVDDGTATKGTSPSEADAQGIALMLTLNKLQ